MENQLRQKLTQGIEQLPLSVSEQQIDLLLQYLQLLIKWNKAYNLTAIRDPLVMIPKHLLDSLVIAPLIKGQRFIDVGAGAGLPGLVLAIVFPERQFDLLDSNGKKTRFLFQAVTELGLSNVTVHHCRVEQHKVEQAYDGVLSRAFATLEDMVAGSEQLLADDGCFYAMKGLYPEAELKQLSSMKKHYNVDNCHSLTVPGDLGERHLVVISQARQPHTSI